MTTPLITALCCGGIGESGPQDARTQVSGMLGEVTRHLDPYKFVPQWHPWQAEYGPVPRLGGASYDESIRRGIDSLVRAIRACPNDVLGLGYSAGATLWGRLLEEFEDGKHPDIVAKVKGVAFVAHPERRRGDSVGRIGDGFGVGGEWFGGPDHIPTLEVAAPEDVICCCPEDSPLRTLADQTSALSFLDIDGWARDLYDRLLTNRWQAVRMNWLHPVGTWRQYRRALDDAAGYLTRRDHVEYHLRIMPGETVTYTVKLAQILNASRFG